MNHMSLPLLITMTLSNIGLAEDKKNDQDYPLASPIEIILKKCVYNESTKQVESSTLADAFEPFAQSEILESARRNQGRFLSLMKSGDYIFRLEIKYDLQKPERRPRIQIIRTNNDGDVLNALEISAEWGKAVANPCVGMNQVELKQTSMAVNFFPLPLLSKKTE